ncbi:MAG TPA: hypothetical protein VJK72_01660 [Candidatus Nanoarchaeia archaeon]|nr:hypothetical protein [Candidatus Nanoarchaeia archaeon]
MVKAKAVTTPKIKKKQWCSIFAPAALNSLVLGETFVSEPEAAIGRVIHANLKSLTDNMRDQSIYLKFKITQVVGKNLQTEVIGYYVMPSSLKKITRRNTRRIDESFVVKTKDGQSVRIKPVIVTTHKTVRSIESALRREMRGSFAREVSVVTFSELLQKLVNHAIVISVKKKLSKIYPVRALEIKIVELARVGKPVEVPSEEPVPVEEQKTEEKKVKGKKKKKTISEEMLEELQGEVDEAAVSEIRAQEEAADTEDFGEEK